MEIEPSLRKVIVSLQGWSCSYALKSRWTLVRRRHSGGGKVENQGCLQCDFLGERQWEKILFQFLEGLTAIKFLLSTSSLWVSSQWLYQAEFLDTKRQRVLTVWRVWSEGENYFCLVIIPATMVKIVWFTLFITCGSLGSSFYNENVIKFISKLDSSLNILWDFLSKEKIATLHLIKYIIFG